MLKYEFESEALVQGVRAYDSTMSIMRKALQEAQEVGTAHYPDTAVIINNIFEAMPHAHVKKSLLNNHDEMHAYATQIIEYYLSAQALRMLMPGAMFSVQCALSAYRNMSDMYHSFLANKNEHISWHTYAKNDKHTYDALLAESNHIDLHMQSYQMHTRAYYDYIDEYNHACKDLSDPINAVRLAFAYLAFAASFANIHHAQHVEHCIAEARPYAKTMMYVEYVARSDVWQEKSTHNIARLNECVHHAYHILMSLSTRLNMSVIKDALNMLVWKYIFHVLDPACKDVRDEANKIRNQYMELVEQKRHAIDAEAHATQAYGRALIHLDTSEMCWFDVESTGLLSTRAMYCNQIQEQCYGIKPAHDAMVRAQYTCQNITVQYHEARKRYFWIIPLLNTLQAHHATLNKIIQ